MINAEFVYKIFSVVTFSYNLSQRKDYIPLHESTAFLQLRYYHSSDLANSKIISSYSLFIIQNLSFPFIIIPVLEHHFLLSTPYPPPPK